MGGVHQAKTEKRVLGRRDKGGPQARKNDLTGLVINRERLGEIYRDEVTIEVSVFLSKWEGQTTQDLQPQAEGLRPSPGGAREPWVGCEQGRGRDSSGT